MDEILLEDIYAAESKGWQKCLDCVRDSISDYPHAGGDIEIMTAIERIELEAYWQGVFDEYDTELNCDLGNTISVDFTRRGALWIK